MDITRLAFLFIVCFSVTVADNSKTSGNRLSKSDLNAAEYLQRFGYIKKDVRFRDVPSNVFKQLLSDALKEFQNFHGLTETGNLDRRTEAAMKQPRCSNADDDQLQLILEKNGDNSNKGYDELNAVRVTWDKSDFPLTYSVDSIPSNLDRSKVMKSIDDAVKEWDRNSGISMIPVASGGRLRLTFEPIDKKWSVLGRGYYPKQGKVIFDSLEDWEFDQRSNGGVNMLKVAIHEIGHALGITHLDKKGSIMYPSYDHDIPAALSSADIDVIQQLYGRQEGVSRSSAPVTQAATAAQPTTVQETSTETISRRRMRNRRKRIEDYLERVFGRRWRQLPFNIDNGSKVTVVRTTATNRNGKVDVKSTVTSNDRSVNTQNKANEQVQKSLSAVRTSSSSSRSPTVSTAAATESAPAPVAAAPTPARTTVSRSSQRIPGWNGQDEISTVKVSSSIVELQNLPASGKYTGAVTELPVKRFLLVGKSSGVEMINSKPNTPKTRSEALLWGSKASIESRARGVIKNPTEMTTTGNYVVVADKDRHCLMKVDARGFSTLVGQCGRAGQTDGSFSVARFNKPVDMCKDRSGNLLVLEQGSSMLRHVNVATRQVKARVLLPKTITFESMTCKSGGIYLTANSRVSARIYKIDLTKRRWSLERLARIPFGKGRDGKSVGEATSNGKFSSIVFNGRKILLSDGGVLREYDMNAKTLGTVCEKGSSFQAGNGGACKISNLAGIDVANGVIYGVDDDANKLFQIRM